MTDANLVPTDPQPEDANSTPEEPQVPVTPAAADEAQPLGESGAPAAPAAETPPAQPSVEAASGAAAGVSPFTEEEARIRTQLYLAERLDYQAGYYQRRSDEFNFNADRMLYVSAFIMGISTVVSSLSVVNDRSILPLVTALLPAFAAAVSAFRSLYQWDRQASLYDEAWVALQQARLTMPDEDYIEPGDYQRAFPDLVDRTEEILRGEAGQWGQISLPVKAGGQGTTPATGGGT
ncbi:MAG TPA: SLATT domain-containing protein [Aggregatilinea sp.]|uniref:SLATT domain-containing protein n=1 Tax=Aggregatilinea sp. TaxID=2806333 RepID=UPI002B6A76CD|nr:SLATT domain-containing protein [Aggregatilinea sp.]HML25008.1 SLATT domain-containing protein [Aggregatilinea sp.]